MCSPPLKTCANDEQVADIFDDIGTTNIIYVCDPPSRTCVLRNVAASVVANRAQRHVVPECVLGCTVEFRFHGLCTLCQNACSDVHSTPRLASSERPFLSSFSRATFSAAPRVWSEKLRAGCERAWDRMRRTAGSGRRLASGQRQRLCMDTASRELTTSSGYVYVLLQGGLAVTVISIVAMLIILYQDGVR